MNYPGFCMLIPRLARTFLGFPGGDRGGTLGFSTSLTVAGGLESLTTSPFFTKSGPRSASPSFPGRPSCEERLARRQL